MPVTAMGPTYAGGEEPLLHEETGYRLLFLPDVNNWERQRAGERPVFYWVPSQVRLARKNGPDAGDYLFNLIRFAGVQSDEGTVGADEDREVAGGVLTFTITGAPPDRVLAELQQKIVDKYESQDDYFWGIRGRKEPIFRPAIITSNVTTISNVAPLPGGAMPAVAEGDGTRSRMVRFASRGNPLVPRSQRAVVRQRDARNSSNLDPWHWQMQGEGHGSISPSAQNAYSALIGAYPTAILWEAFHGTASPITVNQALKLKVWSPVVELSIRGNWSRVYEHFSAAFEAHYLWASVDAKAEFNKMRINGDIEVDIKIDPTIPNGDRVLENIEKRSDLVFEKFMDEARKIIFEPPQPQVEPAEASSGGGFWGVGLALKYRKDQTNLSLNYHEKRQIAYLQQHVVSSSLTGMFEEMQADPEAERKYFLTVYLDDWPRKLARVVKPVCNWADGAVEFLSAQVGYPNTVGEIMWEGQVFQDGEVEDDSWKYGVAQKNASDVENHPDGWSPDKTFIKRKVHLKEPPSAIEDPFRRIQIDHNQIDLDPEPNGTLLNDNAVEVRADSAGRLAVGPVELGVVLQDSTQTVEVVMDPTDDQGQSLGREPVRFVWNYDDQDEDRIWLIYTGDPEFRAFYRYKVRVLVKGSIFEPGVEWEGPWVEAAGNGPITVSIPQKTDPGVTVVRQAPREFWKPEEVQPVRAVPVSATPSDGTNGEARSGPDTTLSPSFRGWSVKRGGGAGDGDGANATIRDTYTK